MNYKDLLCRLDSIQGHLAENGEDESAEAIRDAMLVVREARDRPNLVALMAENKTLSEEGQRLRKKVADLHGSHAAKELRIDELLKQNDAFRSESSGLRQDNKNLKEQVHSLEDRVGRLGEIIQAREARIDELVKEAELHAKAHELEAQVLRSDVKHFKDLNFKLNFDGFAKAMAPTREEMEAEVKRLKEEVKTVKNTGENEKVYLRQRIKELLHQVSSLSRILADVSGKHADRINTGIPTPVHLMGQ